MCSKFLCGCIYALRLASDEGHIASAKVAAVLRVLSAFCSPLPRISTMDEPRNPSIKYADEEPNSVGKTSNTSNSSSSYGAALDAIYSLMTPRIRANESEINFPIMFDYLKILDLEESLSQLKVIHVAGTKGKGSTCTFVESILRKYGFRTGLYTSPHLINIFERYRLDGVEISEEKFLKYFWWCWNRLKENHVEDVHFFRFLTLLALKIFIEEKVDVAILEVGLGGKFDATNVVKSPVVCGISSLGYDHMDILGNSLTEIAREKAGIMKLEVPAFTVPQPEEAMAVLKDTASQLSIPLHVVLPLEPRMLGSLKLGLAGDHQYINAGLAVALCHSWLRRTGHSEYFNLPESATEEGYLPEPFKEGLAMANILGRAQVIPDSYVMHNEHYNMKEAGNADSGQLVFYLDGAHSPESMEACAKWFSHAIRTERQALPETRGGISDTQSSSRILENFCHQHQSTGNSKMKSKQVVLFNCMSMRDPQLLLSRLVNTCHLHGVQFHRALFVPSHSSFTQFCSSTTPDSPKVDLSWQLFLQRTWENLINGTENDQKIGRSFSQKLPSCEFLLSSSQEICPSSAIFPSVPMTIKWLRECVQQNRSLHLEVLVTGSLHLIGDVMRMLKK